MSELGAGLIAESLEKAAESFAPNELAYLALTSKIERPLQDRLAWSLHTQLPGLVVSREWRRTDLAILDARAAKPLALLEAKAMYTADLVGKPPLRPVSYPAKMRGDIAKARDLDSQGGAQVFALALATHPMGMPPNWPNVIKYFDLIKRGLNGFGESGVRQLAAETMGRELPLLGPTRSGSLPGGEAFGVQVAVDWWLVGPAV